MKEIVSKPKYQKGDRVTFDGVPVEIVEDEIEENWTYIVKGGGGYCNLDDCIDMCFAHSRLRETCTRQEVKEFCLEYGFFAFTEGVVLPLFEEGKTSIDFINSKIQKK